MRDGSRQHRWFQFRLRTILIGTALVGALLAVALQWWIVPAQRQRAAVQMVNGMGGRVRYWLTTRDGEIPVVAKMSNWVPRDYFDDVRFVDLRGCQVTDSELVHLKGFTSLEWLDLQGTQVTAAGIAELRAALPDCEIHGP